MNISPGARNGSASGGAASVGCSADLNSHRNGAISEYESTFHLDSGSTVAGGVGGPVAGGGDASGVFGGGVGASALVITSLTCVIACVMGDAMVSNNARNVAQNLVIRLVMSALRYWRAWKVVQYLRCL